MSILEAKEAILKVVEGHFNPGKKPRVPTIKAHGGRFTAEQLKNLGEKTPAILLSVAGWDETEPRGESYAAKVEFIFTVIACDVLGQNRTELAEALASSLSILVTRKGQVWGSSKIFSCSPGKPAATNIYDGQADKAKGVVLWVVRFSQWTSIGDLGLSTLDALLTIKADYDINGDGQPDATDTIKLEKP